MALPTFDIVLFPLCLVERCVISTYVTASAISSQGLQVHVVAAGVNPIVKHLCGWRELRRLFDVAEKTRRSRARAADFATERYDIGLMP